MATGIESSDDQWIAAAQEGDEQAAAHLYGRYADRVFRIIYRIVMDEHLAKDTAQEAWIKVFRHLKKYRLGSSFSAWVSSIAVRTAIDAFRSRRRMISMDSVEEPRLKPTANDSTAWTNLLERELEESVARALQRLPETQRAAFVLRHFEGMALREIGETLGCAEGTVKAHIHRAVRAVREELAPLLEKKVEKP